ncbi:MAG: hypothetical protein IPL79_07675 [Myxococcales bacterium]|nr:hypothetical protein [Myxococcales bacterium]
MGLHLARWLSWFLAFLMVGLAPLARLGAEPPSEVPVQLFVTSERPLIQRADDGSWEVTLGRVFPGAQVTLIKRDGARSVVSTDMFMTRVRGANGTSMVPLQIWIDTEALRAVPVALAPYQFPPGRAVLHPKRDVRAHAYGEGGIDVSCGPAVIVERKDHEVRLTSYQRGFEISGWTSDIERVFGDPMGCYPQHDQESVPSIGRGEQSQALRPVVLVPMRKLLKKPIWWLVESHMSQAGKPQFVCEKYGLTDNVLASSDAFGEKVYAYGVSGLDDIDSSSFTLWGPNNFGSAMTFSPVGFEATKIYFGAETPQVTLCRKNETCSRQHVEFNPSTSHVWFRAQATCRQAARAAMRAVEAAGPRELRALKVSIPLQD